MKRIFACASAILAVALLGAGAEAATSKAQLCESAVETASSKFAACRLKAEASFTKTLNATRHTTDLGKCSTKFLGDFSKAQVRYGAECPMTEPKEDFATLLTQCTDDAADAAHGAGLGCGDNSIDAAGEQCDGTDLGGETCVSLGFPAGTLSCSGCQFDTSACVQSTCGNGTVDGSEQCDGGNLNGASCVSLGFGGGSLTCTAGCAYDIATCDERTVAATGQLTCWDSAGAVVPCAGTGQDGDVRAGSTFAYVDNGDGTITDLNTNLVWEKLDDNNVGGVHDKDSFTTWSDASAIKIATLNTNPCFAGHCDWRLPNVRELQSIASYETGFVGPTVPPAFNTACTEGCTSDVCSCTNADVHWTSTTYAGSPDFAWYVYFADGSVLASPKTFSAYARAVRSGS